MAEYKCRECMDTGYVDRGGYGPSDPPRVEKCPRCEFVDAFNQRERHKRMLVEQFPMTRWDIPDATDIDAYRGADRRGVPTPNTTHVHAPQVSAQMVADELARVGVASYPYALAVDTSDVFATIKTLMTSRTIEIPERDAIEPTQEQRALDAWSVAMQTRDNALRAQRFYNRARTEHGDARDAAIAALRPLTGEQRDRVLREAGVPDDERPKL